MVYELLEPGHYPGEWRGATAALTMAMAHRRTACCRLSRPDGSLNGQTPIDALSAKQEATPFWDEVEARYDPTGERFQVAHYQIDLALRRHAVARVRAQEK